VLAALLLLAAPATAGAGSELFSPDQIRGRIAAAGDAARHNSDTVVVLSDTLVRVRPSGIGTARVQKVVKVLREGGIRSESVQVFPFDPHTNRLDLLTVRVYRSEGSVEEVPLERAVRQPQPAWSIYWGAEQYVLDVPRLAVGDGVETVWELTGFNVAYLAEEGAGESAGEETELNALGEPLRPPVPGHWHDEVHFFSGVPVIEQRYTVRVPRDKPLQFAVFNGELRSSVRFDGDELVYSFEKRDIKPFESEPGMEALPNVGTKLLLATLPSWRDKSRWLYEVSEPTFEPDEAIRRKVAEITAGLSSDEEKITALNHWVAENIRYAGTSRGMCEGYTTHPIVETFHDRAGVCKDKAGMLVGMLRVAGFESYLVMTMARQRVDDIPADQFNHAVTCVRMPDGSLRLLDPTWMPKSRDNWSTLEPEQHVVYGVPEGLDLAQSPYFPPEDNLAHWRARSLLDSAGTLKGRFEFRATGASETRLRRALAGYHPADRPRLFDETIQRLAPNASALVLRCLEPVDFSGPVQVECEYAAAGFALGGGTRRYLRLPMMQTPLGDRTIYDLFDTTSLKERKYALKLLATRLVRLEETVRLPDGWKVVRKPEPVRLDGPAAALNFEIEAPAGEIRYTCELRIKRWQVPPAEYGNFKEVMDKFQELTGRVIICETEALHAEGTEAHAHEGTDGVTGRESEAAHAQH
jgi:hypothetical protein